MDPNQFKPIRNPLLASAVFDEVPQNSIFLSSIPLEETKETQKEVKDPSRSSTPPGFTDVPLVPAEDTPPPQPVGPPPLTAYVKTTSNSLNLRKSQTQPLSPQNTNFFNPVLLPNEPIETGQEALKNYTDLQSSSPQADHRNSPGAPIGVTAQIFSSSNSVSPSAFHPVPTNYKQSTPPTRFDPNSASNKHPISAPTEPNTSYSAYAQSGSSGGPFAPPSAPQFGSGPPPLGQFNVPSPWQPSGDTHSSGKPPGHSTAIFQSASGGQGRNSNQYPTPVTLPSSRSVPVFGSGPFSLGKFTSYFQPVNTSATAPATSSPAPSASLAPSGIFTSVASAPSLNSAPPASAIFTPAAPPPSLSSAPPASAIFTPGAPASSLSPAPPASGIFTPAAPPPSLSSAPPPSGIFPRAASTPSLSSVPPPSGIFTPAASTASTSSTVFTPYFHPAATSFAQSSNGERPPSGQSAFVPGFYSPAPSQASSLSEPPSAGRPPSGQSVPFYNPLSTQASIHSAPGAERPPSGHSATFFNPASSLSPIQTSTSEPRSSGPPPSTPFYNPASSQAPILSASVEPPIAGRPPSGQSTFYNPASVQTASQPQSEGRPPSGQTTPLYNPTSIQSSTSESQSGGPPPSSTSYYNPASSQAPAQSAPIELPSVDRPPSGQSTHLYNPASVQSSTHELQSVGPPPPGSSIPYYNPASSQSAPIEPPSVDRPPSGQSTPLYNPASVQSSASEPPPQGSSTSYYNSASIQSAPIKPPSGQSAPFGNTASQPTSVPTSEPQSAGRPPLGQSPPYYQVERPARTQAPIQSHPTSTEPPPASVFFSRNENQNKQIFFDSPSGSSSHQQSAPVFQWPGDSKPANPPPPSHSETRDQSHSIFAGSSPLSDPVEKSSLAAPPQTKPPSLTPPPLYSSLGFSPAKPTEEVDGTLELVPLENTVPLFDPKSIGQPQIPPQTKTGENYFRLGGGLKRPSYAPVPDLGISKQNHELMTDPGQQNEVETPQVEPTQIGGSHSSEPVAHNSQSNEGQYTPPYHHWFYRKGEAKSHWEPFSVTDSLNLEHAFHSQDLREESKIATDGGRYDVQILLRKKIAVYWDEPPSEVRRCSWFVKGLMESRYVPYDENTAELLEDEYKNGCLKNEWNRRIELADGEVVVLHSANSLSHQHRSSSPDTWGNPATVPQKPRIVKRGLDDFEIAEGEPTQVDHLLLVVHGIGKVCDLRFRSLVQVVDDFRAISIQLMQSHFRHSTDSGLTGRIEILPVEWHGALHTEAIDKKLADITLPSIPKAREFTNDTILDVLFYSSPVFCERIVQAVGAELNRVYSLYLQRNPGYKGGVSLGGHSLGSLILFDMLSHQKVSPKPVVTHQSSFTESDEDLSQLGCTPKAKLSRRMSYLTIGTEGAGQPFITYPQLNFHPKALFAFGSPIGMFLTVRGVESLGEDFHFPTCPKFLNIYHPNDPVAYRIEALISNEMAAVPPVLIPHHKGRKRMHLELRETMSHVTAALKQKLVESVRSTWNTVYQLAMFQRPDPGLRHEVDQALEDEALRHTSLDGHLSPNLSSTQSLSEETGLDLSVGSLNGGRRIDYVLQEAPLETFNQYISAIRSHLVYWESEDTTLLVLKEIYDSLGIRADSQIPQQILPFDIAAADDREISEYTDGMASNTNQIRR